MLYSSYISAFGNSFLSENMILVVAFTALILGLAGQSFLIDTHAEGKSPYKLGHDYGCDDARITDLSNRYVHEPQKNPSFHTDQFLQGYYAGFSSCSVSINSGDSTAGDGSTFADGQSAGITQGQSDALNGRPLDDSCSPDRNDDYCRGYRSAYTIEYQWVRWKQDQK
jgi:hypothetical protein